jgi:hypothetical protein
LFTGSFLLTYPLAALATLPYYEHSRSTAQWQGFWGEM